MMRLSRLTWIGIALWVIVATGVLFGIEWYPMHAALSQAQITPSPSRSTFYEDFSTPTVFDETRDMDDSASEHWWISSGGQLIVEEGVGKTLQGDLPEDAYWRVRYGDSKPVSTDDGYHPQNTFRLVTRTTWYNTRQQAYFRITNDNLSVSEARNASNGLLLFSRYQDQDNVYYAGVRVDGAAVIKKKWNGEYTTLAYEPVFEGEYDRDAAPNLLPKQQWIGIRLDTRDTPQGEVEIEVYLDLDLSGDWQRVLFAIDAEFMETGAPPWIAGYAGMRTDFMDVEFDDYLIVCLEDCN